MTRLHSPTRFLALIGAIVLLAFTVGADTPPPNKPADAPSTPAPKPQLHRDKKVAALIADWFPGSHPDSLFTRIFQTYSRDDKGYASKLELVSVYRDLPTERDQTAAGAIARVGGGGPARPG